MPGIPVPLNEWTIGIMLGAIAIGYFAGKKRTWTAVKWLFGSRKSNSSSV